MKTLLFVLVSLAFAEQLVASFPTETSFPQAPYPENTAKTQTLEILLQNTTRGVDCSVADVDKPNAKNGLISQHYRWKEFPIYIDTEYTDRLSKVIPCIKFGIWGKNESPAEYKGTYIHIKKSLGGCWSYVGKGWRNGPQEMSLDDGCMTIGIIMHEMIHALGFHHDQGRPDRDDFVTINWENIRRGYESNFKKYGYSQVTTFAVPYNTKSIMHYPSYAFSANGKPTIVTKTGNTIPYLRELQETDISKLKKMYKC